MFAAELKAPAGFRDNVQNIEAADIFTVEIRMVGRQKLHHGIKVRHKESHITETCKQQALNARHDTRKERVVKNIFGFEA